MVTKRPLSAFTYAHRVVAADLSLDGWHEVAVGLHDARLDYAEVLRLRNWLNDWLGHHRATLATHIHDA